MTRQRHANERFSNNGLKFDRKVRQAFEAYRTACRNGTVQDDEGLCLRHAQILSAVDAPRDVICLALLEAMPGATHARLAEEFEDDALPGLIREMKRQPMEEYRHLSEASGPVRMVAMANAIAFLGDFLDDAKKFEEGKKTAPPGSELQMPLIANEELVALLYAQVQEGEHHLALSHAFLDALREALPFHKEYKKAAVEGTRKTAGGMIHKALDPDTAQEFPDFARAYNFITTQPLINEDDFGKAMRTMHLMTLHKDEIEPPTMAAALLDIAYRMRGPSQIMPAGTGPEVTAILRGRSVYSVYDAEDLQNAPPEFNQIAIAHAIVQLDEHLEKGRQFFSDAKTKLHVRRYQSQIVAALMDTEKAMSGTYAPAARETTPGIRDRFDQALERLSRLIDPYRPKPPSRKTTPGRSSP